MPALTANARRKQRHKRWRFSPSLLFFVFLLVRPSTRLSPIAACSAELRETATSRRRKPAVRVHRQDLATRRTPDAVFNPEKEKRSRGRPFSRPAAGKAAKCSRARRRQGGLRSLDGGAARIAQARQRFFGGGFLGIPLGGGVWFGFDPLIEGLAAAS